MRLPIAGDIPRAGVEQLTLADAPSAILVTPALGALGLATALRFADAFCTSLDLVPWVVGHVADGRRTIEGAAFVEAARAADVCVAVGEGGLHVRGGLHVLIGPMAAATWSEATRAIVAAQPPQLRLVEGRLGVAAALGRAFAARH